MKVRVLRPLLTGHDSRTIPKNAVIDVSEYRAREMQRRGQAVPLLNGVRPINKVIAVANPDSLEVAEAGTANPQQPSPPSSHELGPPIGSPTGEAKPVSPLPPVPRRKRRRSSKRKAALESSS